MHRRKYKRCNIVIQYLIKIRRLYICRNYLCSIIFFSVSYPVLTMFKKNGFKSYVRDILNIEKV